MGMAERGMPKRFHLSRPELAVAVAAALAEVVDADNVNGRDYGEQAVQSCKEMLTRGPAEQARYCRQFVKEAEIIRAECEAHRGDPDPRVREAIAKALESLGEAEETTSE